MTIVPAPDETLISFASRVSLDAPVAWHEFQRAVFGRSFTCARAAERKCFDWDQVAAKLSISAAEVRQLSERSQFPPQFSDAKVESIVRAGMPWLASPGYPTYNPVALTVDPGLKRRWFQPFALYDRESGTLNLRHCYRCGELMAAARTAIALPSCRCGAPLSAGPRLQASAAVVALADQLESHLRESLASEVNPDAPPIRLANVAWRIVEALDTAPTLAAHAASWSMDSGMGELQPPPPTGKWDPGWTLAGAVRHAQLLGAATMIVREFPEVVPPIHDATRRSGQRHVIMELVTSELLNCAGCGARTG